MNKKQIMKISYCRKRLYSNNDKSECYGIYLGDNKLLLEDLSIIDLFKNIVSRPITDIDEYYIKNNYGYVSRIEEYGRTENLTAINITATRNVPVEIRKGLEKAYESVDKILKMDRKLDKIHEEYRNEMEIQMGLIKDIPKICRDSRGILTNNEFLEEFEKNLSFQVTNKMEENEYKAYIYALPTKIYIEREVMIEKWASPSYSYLEYDDTRQVNRDYDPEAYDKDLKTYSKPLPVEGKITESMSLGDKNWLIYSGGYVIDVNKPLTKEYAKELAEKFCGTKTLNNEKDEEEDEDIEMI